MIELRDRIEMPDMQVIKSRFDPIPESYILHIRERFNDDGSVTTIHRKRLYEGGIIHGVGRIEDEEI